MIIGKLNIYEDFLLMKGMSVFSGEQKDFIKVESIPETPLMKAFLEDDDIQEIQVCSTNIGFVRTFQKVFKKKEVKNA